MTDPNADLKPASPRPPRLAFMTVPLLVMLFTQAIALLRTPFMGNDLNAMLAEYGKLSGVNLPPLTPDMIQMVLWISLFVTMGLILWLYFTRRALLEGKSWGRVSAIVIGVLSLPLLPIGTVLGIAILMGAFDREVTRYASR